MLGRLLCCFALVPVAAALLGCGGIEEQRKQLANTYRPAIERNLAAWPAIAEQVRNLPPLTQDTLAGTFVVDAVSGHEQAANASLCYAEDLTSPDELGYVWERIPNTGQLNHCGSFLHRRHLAYDPAHPELRLPGVSVAEGKWRYPRCAGYRYLLVIRSLEFLEPSAASRATEPFVPVAYTLDLDAPPPPAPAPAPAPRPSRKSRKAKTDPAVVPSTQSKPEAAETLLPVRTTESKNEMRYLFEGGFLRAEVLAFELPGGKLLGGVRFSAQNSVTVDGRGDGVREDWRRQMAKAVEGALGKLARPAPGGAAP